MSLTMGSGPFAGGRDEYVNYRYDGPEHLLFARPLPRRVRAAVGERTAADVAWGYAHPLENALGVVGHVCFSSDDVGTTVDGEAA